MPVVVDEKTDSAKEFVSLLKKYEPVFDKLTEYPKLEERVKALEAENEHLRGLNHKQVMEEFDKIKAAQDTMAKTIRTSKRGLYVSGIEDQEFSMLRASMGHQIGWKEAGAEHEFEIIKQANEKAREIHKEGPNLVAKSPHNIGDDRFGGNWIPDQVLSDVIAEIYSTSVFFNLGGEGRTRVTAIEGLVGGNVSVPKFEGGMVVYWQGEEDEAVESLTSSSLVTLNPKKLVAMAAMTEEMRNFPTGAFETMFRNDLRRNAAAKIDWTIPYGKGTAHQPAGIVNQRGVVVYSAQADASFKIGENPDGLNAGSWNGAPADFDKLARMKLFLRRDKVVPDDSWSWISSPDFFHTLKKIKVAHFSGQTVEKAYLLGMPMLSDAKLREVIGDYDETEQIPYNLKPGASVGATPNGGATSTHTDLFSGNLSNIVVGRWAGIEMVNDRGLGLGFKTGISYSRFRLWMDIAVRQERALILCPDFSVA